jgi:hypothetical protein
MSRGWMDVLPPARLVLDSIVGYDLEQIEQRRTPANR